VQYSSSFYPPDVPTTRSSFYPPDVPTTGDLHHFHEQLHSKDVMMNGRDLKPNHCVPRFISSPASQQQHYFDGYSSPPMGFNAPTLQMRATPTALSYVTSALQLQSSCEYGEAGTCDRNSSSLFSSAVSSAAQNNNHLQG